MNTIYWHMNATYGGANLHPGVNLLPGANLHPGANCAHEHGFTFGFRIRDVRVETFDAINEAFNILVLMKEDAFLNDIIA